MRHNPPALPQEIIVLERNWLSANNVLFLGPRATALVDSGYCSNAAQTVALVQSGLGGRPLATVLFDDRVKASGPSRQATSGAVPADSSCGSLRRSGRLRR